MPTLACAPSPFCAPAASLGGEESARLVISLMSSEKLGAQAPLRRSSSARAWTRDDHSAAPGGFVVVDLVREVVRRSLRVGIASVACRWWRRDLRVCSGRILGVRRVVRDFWLLARLGLVVFAEETSMWVREDGTRILTALDDIV